MKLVTKAYVIENKKKFLEEIKYGKNFIFPTEKGYFLGTTSMIDNSINKIKKLTCFNDDKFFLLSNKVEKMSKKEILDFKDNINNGIEKDISKDYLSKEIPENIKFVSISGWFIDFLKDVEFPIFFCEPAYKEKESMTSFYDLDENIKANVDYIILEGTIKRERFELDKI